MPADEFRQYGHQMIDWIADFLDNAGDIPAFPDVQPGDIRGKLPSSPPITGEAMEQILADVDRVIMDYGIPLGRRFRALKLWFTLRYFGVEGIASRIREHLRLAAKFAGLIDAHPEFERLAPIPLSTICFRAHPQGLDDDEALNALNERLLRAINQTGEAFLSHTRLDGRFTIRLVISHLRTNEAHINRVWELAQEKLNQAF